MEKINKRMKIRINGIDFARVCCTLGIINFHFFGHSHSKLKHLFLKSANSTYGFMFVTTFFAISGAVLYYNYHNVTSLKTFYYKRWKSIFPSYYLCFLYFFMKNVFYLHKLFFRSHWSYLIFTILGMDGYFSYKYKTYHLIGEWFLGAIILIYIINPLLSYSINKNIFIIQFFFFIGYLWMKKTKFFIITIDCNLITCIQSFYFGMISMKSNAILLTNRISGIIAFIILIFLCNFHLPRFILFNQIQGFSLFIILVHLGNYVMKKKFKSIFLELSKLSYSMYLIHHRIINDILGVNNPKEWYNSFTLLGVSILLIIIYAKILFIIIDSIFHSNLFMKIENKFIKYDSKPNKTNNIIINDNIKLISNEVI